MRRPALLRSLSSADAAPDADLLARFVAGRDASAFELLVWRHAGMVSRVCRGVLGDRHAAEDATQATFLALYRKAHAVGRGTVAGWLYRVARRVSFRAAERARRSPSGSPELLDHAPAPEPSDGPDPALTHAVQDEVANLPERYRVPVLLCFFEGLTHQAAADRLGVPIGTLATRVARAKDRLRRGLSARGITAPAGALVVALTGRPTIASPMLVAAIVRAAGDHSGVSKTVLELAEGATRMTGLAKMRWAAVVVAACGTVAAGGWWAADGQESPKPPAAKLGDAPAKAAPFTFSTAPLEVNELAAALSLNIYKYQFEIPKGQKFDVVLRELDDKDAAPRELKRFKFRKGDKDGPTTIRVDFLRRDGVVGGVLLTEEKEAVYRVTCRGCDPSEMASIVPVPLSGVKLTERTLIPWWADEVSVRAGLEDMRLLSVVHNKPTPGVMNYPRAELLIEKKE